MCSNSALPSTAVLSSKTQFNEETGKLSCTPPWRESVAGIIGAKRDHIKLTTVQRAVYLQIDFFKNAEKQQKQLVFSTSQPQNGAPLLI